MSTRAPQAMYMSSRSATGLHSHPRGRPRPAIHLPIRSPPYAIKPCPAPAGSTGASGISPYIIYRAQFPHRSGNHSSTVWHKRRSDSDSGQVEKCGLQNLYQIAKGPVGVGLLRIGSVIKLGAELSGKHWS